MTAEIAVLNSQAVALAADSAVTVSDGTNRAPKIYPFAQTEMIATFMEGISPTITATIYNYMQRISEELPNAVVGDAADGGMPSDQRDSIRDGLS